MLITLEHTRSRFVKVFYTGLACTPPRSHSCPLDDISVWGGGVAVVHYLMDMAGMVCVCVLQQKQHGTITQRCTRAADGCQGVPEIKRSAVNRNVLLFRGRSATKQGCCGGPGTNERNPVDSGQAGGRIKQLELFYTLLMPPSCLWKMSAPFDCVCQRSLLQIYNHTPTYPPINQSVYPSIYLSTNISLTSKS